MFQSTTSGAHRSENQSSIEKYIVFFIVENQQFQSSITFMELQRLVFFLMCGRSKVGFIHSNSKPGCSLSSCSQRDAKYFHSKIKNYSSHN